MPGLRGAFSLLFLVDCSSLDLFSELPGACG